MNYRHAYHAGNFADVVKHVALTRLVEYLKRKDKAFRVIDTHAGIGLYDLSSTEAQKTGEWRDGIGRLLEARLSPAAGALMAPYIDAVKSENPKGGLVRLSGVAEDRSPLAAENRIACWRSSFTRVTRHG